MILSDGPVAVGANYRQVRSLPSRSEETLVVTARRSAAPKLGSELAQYLVQAFEFGRELVVRSDRLLQDCSWKRHATAARQGLLLVIFAAVRALPGGNCNLSPPTPAVFILPEPIGDRQLLDGYHIPPAPPTEFQ